MIVEQVSLTPEQLAQKALQRAQKAMESNELQTAVSAYTEALRYTPHDEMARQNWRHSIMAKAMAQSV